ncbi:heavy-metal-associated domain-containing protein [Candidatus Protofrankia californiensis]|uniref:heavy-metal-associated domain-containing protein n=1 Tax=Candidatus Protofrankia californiensis TaxID=1839754 RepID=UPI0019D2A111|nr:heavy metal-associated domain-containing protein [Candidatus Protofrankia californiensis]
MTTTTHTYTCTVVGMTCSHCVSSVSTEIGLIPGVSDVRVDLDSGAVTVTSEHSLEETAVRAAVDEAGYELRRPEELNGSTKRTEQ